MKKFIPAVVLLLLTSLCLRRWFAPHGQIAEIIQNGRIIARLNLKHETGTRTIDIHSSGGGFNRLLIEKGRVKVLCANCPGQDCVRMGWLRSASLPLVCLPHGLTVRYSMRSEGELDSLSQ